MSAAPENMVGGANKPSLVMKFAQKYNVVEATLLNTLKSTCFRQSEGDVSNEQMVALLVVADQYNLNPFTKEIYAYPDKYKGIVPVVSIDGWVRIVTEHEDYNGYDVILPDAMIKSFVEGEHPPCWPWITIKMHRKRVEFTPPLTEYFDECYKPPYKPRGKDYFIDSPWQTHPKRFLRHKAFIQAGRMVFGFAGIYDDDEAQRIVASGGQADPHVVAVQDGKTSRTSTASDALKNKLGITNQAGTGALDMTLKDLGRLEESRKDTVVAEQGQNLNQQQKTRESEWADPKSTGGIMPNRREGGRYDIETGVAALRAATSIEVLDQTFQMIQDDFDFSGRELPVDIEANYGDLKEAFETGQRQ